jgi:hypothetical protein
LNLRIWLDKNTYDAGETAKGTLLIKANSSIKVRKLSFSVRGKERYLEETKSKKRGMVGGLGRSTETEKYDTFFFEDLSPFLKLTSSISYVDDRIEIPQGSTALPFHFSIPHNALESYRGKHARIAYEVEILADLGRWKGGYHYTLIFAVTNPRMTYTFGDSLYLGKEKEKKEGEPPLHMKLETKDDTSDIPRFSPGEIMRGRLIIKNGGIQRIRKAIIQLNTVEHLKWRPSRIISQNIKEEIKYDKNKDMDMIAFGIQIPKRAKRSYSAKYSEYYWLLETHVDISNNPVFHAKKVVQIA